MKHPLENGFHLVYKAEILIHVVKFLKLGFGWDKIRIEKIMMRLQNQSKIVPKAALFCQDREIKIAILLFDQTGADNGHKKIINLSSWYAKESHRGIDAIRFAKKLTTTLCDYIITNYTPSAAALKVFAALGYEKMNVEVVSLGVQKTFPFLKLKPKKKYFTFRHAFEKPVNLSKDQRDIKSDIFFKVYSVNRMGIKVNILSIFLDKQERYIPIFWFIKIIFSYGVLRINIYSRIDSIPLKSPWLIKNFHADRYISPQNSELAI